MKNRKILWVTPKWPLPASDGARQATCSALKAISKLGEEIDLLSFIDKPIKSYDEQLIKDELGIQRVFTILKTNYFGKFSRFLNLIYSTFSASSLPFTVIPFTSNLDSVLSHNIDNSPWTHIVFDGLHPSVSFLSSKKINKFKDTKWIYRAHNLEANLWKQSAKKAGLFTNWILKIQERKIRELEAGLVDSCEALATVSYNDLSEFQSTYKTPLSKAISIGADFSIAPSHINLLDINPTCINLIFIGSTSWRPNREGLLWFLQEVWPSVSANRSDITIKIIGRGTEKLKSKFKNLSRIEFLGELKSLDSVYANSHAAIVPIFSGSGTRVKAIEASRFGRACISTQLGVEGLPLKEGFSYVRVENQQEWITTLSRISSNNLIDIGNKAYQELKKDFDSETVGKSFVELLNSI